jgi:hypothetical protein
MSAKAAIAFSERQALHTLHTSTYTASKIEAREADNMILPCSNDFRSPQMGGFSAGHLDEKKRIEKALFT